MKPDEIVEMILKAARESRVFSDRVYKDEPIVRTGRQAFGSQSRSSKPSRPAQDVRVEKVDSARGSRWRDTLSDMSLSEIVARTTGKVPERIAEMRRISGRYGSRAFSYADPVRFYELARFMEDYTDSMPYVGEFSKFYPTYEDMTTSELRGYFTWRTRWRAGEAPATSLSYVFVYVYEVLCGVGVSGPAGGLVELMRLRDSYGSRPGFEALVSYLNLWMSDYVTYHGLPRDYLGRDAQGSPLDRAVAVIDQAEQALLASKDPAVWEGPGLPSHEDLVFALAAASTYRLERSKVFTDHFDELGECCAAVFARMVSHCSRRRKKGFSQGLFGDPVAEPYVMFRSAVFHDPVTHPDCEVRLESGVVFQCRLGRWTRLRPHASEKASSELGDILHEVDRTLRLRLGGIAELKEREIPKYQRAIIDEVVDACLERRAAEEAARVRIDRSALSTIRAASVRTREALLVDEERVEDLVPVEEPATPAVVQQEPDPRAIMDDGSADEPTGAPEAEQGSLEGLSADDVAILRSLLDGTFDAAAVRARGIMVSLVADRINEVFFDILGDAVIEFDGDDPRVVEDYEEDVREVLG